jgi:hypothetical protein
VGVVSLRRRLDAIVRSLPGLVVDRPNDTQQVLAELADFATRIERSRSQRLAGGRILTEPRACSFRDMADQWASYYGPEESAPVELTRAIDARIGGQSVATVLLVLVLARRYRDLARRGEQASFSQRWVRPTVEEANGLLAEFNKATDG